MDEEIHVEVCVSSRIMSGVVTLTFPLSLTPSFHQQLPKMPKEYIVRLVFDRRHRAVALCRGPLAIGGICYRPYPTQRFAEIAFCAITATEVRREGWSGGCEEKSFWKAEFSLTYSFSSFSPASEGL